MKSDTTIWARIVGWLARLLCLVAFSDSGWAQGDFLQIRNGYFWDPGAGEYFFPRGFAYQTWNPPVYANQSFEQLDYDLTEFKKMYANSVRVDLVWGELERSEGVYDWSRSDYLVQRAEELGLRLFVLIGYQYPPYWFPNDWRGTNDHGLPSNVLNYEHPEARRAYGDHMAAVTERYKTSRAIAGWILGNEYAYFDLWEPLQAGESHRMLGYDSLSQKSFRTYLAAAYQGNIALLNANWGTRYGDFDSVVMPRSYPSTRHNPAYHDLIQWRKKSIGDFVASGAVVAKRADPHHLLTYSMVGLVYSTDDDNNTCEDAKTIVACCKQAGAPLDFWSVNNYAWSKVGSELRTADFGIAKYQAQSGLPLMVSETGYSDTENHYSGAKERHAKAVPSQLWEAAVSGAIGVHLFHWNDRDPFAGDFVRERGFGIVRQNRTIKEPVYWNVLEVFRRMEGIRIGSLLGGSSNPKPDSQFFWSTNADMGWPRANYENASVWGALRRLGYQPGIIDDEQFERGAYTNAAALILSRCYQMDAAHLEAIASKVIPAGVHVYANADLPGQFNAYHRRNANWPAVMASVFGIDVTQARPGLDGGVTGAPTYQQIHFKGLGSLGSFSPAYSEYLETWKIWYGIRTGSSGNTIVTHSGIEYAQPPTPALVIKDHGRARTAINTFALGDTAPVSKEKPPLTHEWDVRYDWLRTIFREHFGIFPSIDLSGSPGAKYVLPDYRICRNGSVLVSLLNEHTNAATVTLAAPALLSGKTVENLKVGGILQTSPDGRLTVNLAGDEYVLLYAYTHRPDRDESLINSSPRKLWFESAPTAIWPNESGYAVNVGYDTRGEDLNLFVSLELVGSRNITYGKSAAAVVSGTGSQAIHVPVPDADLGDPDYVSSRMGAKYVWHAWLEQSGVRVSETYLPVRLLWGVRPIGLPAKVAPGATYAITLEWEELPSYEAGETPAPLSRADLWESLKSNAEHYNVVLELRSAGQVAASDNFVTSAASSSHEFSILVPRSAAGPFAWIAYVQPSADVSSQDLHDSFEGRALGAWASQLATNANAGSPLGPWQSYLYPADGAQQWFDEGVQLEGSDGSQSAFVIVTNPPPSSGYSGFGIRYVFDSEWALPEDSRSWIDYTFSCDFRLNAYHDCVVELQVKNEDLDGAGRWIQFAQPYRPGSNGWQTIEASLDQFIKPPWSFASFDPGKVREIVVNIVMLETNVVFEAAFDRIRFDSPDTAGGVGSCVAIYRSDNDSASRLPDADGDGIPDLHETNTGIYLNPADTGTNPNRVDSDGDGQTDGQEVLAGTDPNKPDDRFVIASRRRDATGEIVISWPARKGRVYGVYYCDGGLIDGGRFVPLENLTNLTAETDGVMEVLDASAAAAKLRFYRVSVQTR